MPLIHSLVKRYLFLHKIRANTCAKCSYLTRKAFGRGLGHFPWDNRRFGSGAADGEECAHDFHICFGGA